MLVSYCPLCASGIVFDRHLNGDVLTFGNTSALYGNDLAMARPEGREQLYERDPFVGHQDRVDAGQLPFPVSEGSDDPRLSAGTRVFGIQVDGQTVAYPLEVLAGQRIEHQIAGTDVIVDLAEDGAGGRAWRRTHAGELELLGTRTLFWFAFVSAFPDTQVSTIWPRRLPPPVTIRPGPWRRRPRPGVRSPSRCGPWR